MQRGSRERGSGYPGGLGEHEQVAKSNGACFNMATTNVSTRPERMHWRSLMSTYLALPNWDVGVSQILTAGQASKPALLTAQRVNAVKSQFIVHVPIASSMLCMQGGIAYAVKWCRVGRRRQRPRPNNQHARKRCQLLGFYASGWETLPNALPAVAAVGTRH